jgi:hypothetical protein
MVVLKEYVFLLICLLYGFTLEDSKTPEKYAREEKEY